MTVEILATCRNTKLIEMTRLVFRTIRVGFPSAKIKVWGNGLNPLVEELIARDVDAIGGAFSNFPEQRHDEWFQKLLWMNMQPYVVCDTDMVFYDEVQSWVFQHPWAGAFQPEYLDPWSHTVHRPRMHTSLMFIRPDEIRDRMLRFDGRFKKAPIFPGTINFIGQQLQPVMTEAGTVVHFADTGANLYQCIGGDAFSEAQLDAFAHLHAGTWSDLLNLPEVTELHAEILKDPNVARGIWRRQREFYEKAAPK